MNLQEAGVTKMISFKWRHFEKEIILMAIRWYTAYSLSYRNIEELMEERGITKSKISLLLELQ